MEMETLAKFKQVIYKKKMCLACDGKDRSWKKNLEHSLRRDCNSIETFAIFSLYNWSWSKSSRLQKNDSSQYGEINGGRGDWE